MIGQPSPKDIGEAEAHNLEDLVELLARESEEERGRRRSSRKRNSRKRNSKKGN